jgi:hypothetical protein
MKMHPVANQRLSRFNAGIAGSTAKNDRTHGTGALPFNRQSKNSACNSTEPNAKNVTLTIRPLTTYWDLQNKSDAQTIMFQKN